MKSSQSQATSLTKQLMFSAFLAMTLIASGCSDAGQDDQKQASSEEAKKDDKTASADSESETDPKTDDKDKKDEKPPVPVEIVSVTRGDIRQTYSTITTLEAERDAQVVARSTGLLQSIEVEEGDTVTKGQLLAQLDVEQLSLEVAQLQATSKKLAREMQRQKTLFSRKLGSSDALDRATFEHQAQQAQLNLAKLKLRYASIKAPIDGIITERQVKTGNLIRENDILFTIVDTQSLKAVLHLPEKELHQVKKGQNVLLQVDALKGQTLVGEIERIRPAIDTDTGTFKVVARLDNQQQQLTSGMFGQVEVVFDIHADSLLVQQQAIITQDNRSHVFVVQDNKALQTPIEIGYRHDGMVEITGGLKENDKVITTGQQILKHESIIEVVGNEDIAKVPAAGQEAATQNTNVAANP